MAPLDAQTKGKFAENLERRTEARKCFVQVESSAKVRSVST